MRIFLAVFLAWSSVGYASGELRRVMEAIDREVIESLREPLQRVAKTGENGNALWALDAIVRSKVIKENPEIELYLKEQGLRYLDDGSMSDVLESAYLEYLMGTPIYLERLIEQENLKHDRQIKPGPLTGEDGSVLVSTKENRISGRIMFGRHIHYGIGADRETLWGYEFDRGWYRIEPWEVGGAERYKELLNDEPKGELYSKVESDILPQTAKEDSEPDGGINSVRSIDTP